MRLRFTPLALAEIEQVFQELASRSPQGSRRLRNRLERATRSMREYPALGQITDIPTIRRVVLQPYPYLLFYRIAATEIVVVGIRHGARDPATMPGEDMADDLP